MMRAIKPAIITLAVALGLWLSYSKVIKRYYMDPRALAMESIAKSNAELARYREAAQNRPRVQQELQQFVDRTLGGDYETVDHRLRTRLNRLRELYRLDGAPNTYKPEARLSPAKSLFSRSMQNEIDFYELEASLNGTGAYEDVLALIDAIEREPWIKRIDQLKIDPTPKDNGERVTLSLRLTTLFLPGKSPRPDHTPAARAENPARLIALTQSNPFRVPPKPAKEERIAAVAPPPGFAYDQWRVTGVAESDGGAEIWLLNRQTSESRRLIVGDTFQDVTLIAAAGERAEFKVGDERFIVPVGSTLNDRMPVKQ